MTVSILMMRKVERNSGLSKLKLLRNVLLKEVKKQGTVTQKYRISFCKVHLQFFCHLRGETPSELFPELYISLKCTFLNYFNQFK
jgi:hypothetical protein